MHKRANCFAAMMALTLLFAALIFWGTFACAQIENSSERTSEAIIGGWIDQLGDESFRVREEATENLRAQGFRAIPLLRKALLAKELEVRLRVQNLLKDLEHRAIDEKIAALLSDTDDATEHDLPMWKIWREKVGADAESRRFFANILKADYGLIANVEFNSDQAGQEYSRRIGDLLLEVLSQGRSVDMTDLGALLLVGADERIAFDIATAMRYYSILQSSRTVEAVVGTDFDVPALRLLANWIERSSENSTFQSYGARLALHYGLDDLALTIARKSLVATNHRANEGDSMDFSILVVALHGSTDDIKTLEKWFNDETRCGSWIEKKIETQIRDVALAAVIELSKKNLADFGFEFALEKMEGSYGWYPTWSLGFENDNKRKAAFEKWKNWQAATTVNS